MKTTEEIQEAMDLIVFSMIGQPTSDMTMVGVALLTTLAWVIDDPKGKATEDLLRNLKTSQQNFMEALTKPEPPASGLPHRNQS